MKRSPFSVHNLYESHTDLLEGISEGGREPYALDLSIASVLEKHKYASWKEKIGKLDEAITLARGAHDESSIGRLITNLERTLAENRYVRSHATAQEAISGYLGRLKEYQSVAAQRAPAPSAVIPSGLENLASSESHSVEPGLAAQIGNPLPLDEEIPVSYTRGTSFRRSGRIARFARSAVVGFALVGCVSNPQNGSVYTSPSGVAGDNVGHQMRDLQGNDEYAPLFKREPRTSPVPTPVSAPEPVSVSPSLLDVPSVSPVIRTPSIEMSRYDVSVPRTLFPFEQVDRDEGSSLLFDSTYRAPSQSSVGRLTILAPTYALPLSPVASLSVAVVPDFVPRPAPVSAPPVRSKASETFPGDTRTVRQRLGRGGMVLAGDSFGLALAGNAQLNELHGNVGWPGASSNNRTRTVEKSHSRSAMGSFAPVNFETSQNKPQQRRPGVVYMLEKPIPAFTSRD